MQFYSGKVANNRLVFLQVQFIELQMCFISVPFVSGRTDRPYHNLSADLSKNCHLIEVMKQASKCA